MYRLLALGLVGLSLAPPAQAQQNLAQEFPQRPLTLIVPVAPGGGSDILARVIADKLSPILKQPVVVDNKPGGGHVVGTSIGAKAEPDGHTITMVGTPHVTNPSLIADLPFDAIKDFKPVMMLAQLPIVLVANSQSPYRSVQELVADARKRPGEISFASTSTNGSGHLAGELLKLRAGIDMLHIPYRGSAAALPDVIAGRVPVMFDALVTAEPHIEAGALRPLAVSTLTRAAAFPNVPTMIESGYKDYYVAAWLGFLVPAKTPDAAADKLNKTVAQVLQDKDVIATLTKQGWEIMPYGPSRQDFAKFLEAEKIKWDGVIKAAKLKAP